MILVFPIAFLESLGGGEVAVIFVVILLLFGSRRLPEIARLLGRTSAQFHRAFQEFKDQLMQEELPDTPPPLEPPDPDAAAVPEEYADADEPTDAPRPPAG